MSVDTLTAHACTCLDKTPLFVDGDTDSVYHETCEGYIGDTSDMALNDSFWNFQIEDRESAVVINGVHYRIGSKPYPQKGYGFDGEHYRIKMIETGAVIDTRDLWHQGTVPEEYRGILQDTAKFVRLISVSQPVTCPSCKREMNRDECPFTSCVNGKFDYSEKIEVKRG